MLTVKQAAAYLGATVWFVRNLAWNKAIPYLTFGHRMVFDRVDLDHFIEKQKQAA